MPLVCLKFMRIVDDSPKCNLMLTFEKDVQINVKAKSHNDRERLIACLLTVRSLALSENHGIASLDNLKILQNRSSGLDLSHKIQAYTPIEDSFGIFSQTLTQEYESGLIRKLSEHMHSEV